MQKDLTTIHTNWSKKNLKVQSKSVHLEITVAIVITTTTLMIVGLHQSEARTMPKCCRPQIEQRRTA